MKFILPVRILFLCTVIFGLFKISIMQAEQVSLAKRLSDKRIALSSDDLKKSTITQLPEKWAKLLDNLSNNTPDFNTLFSSQNLKLNLTGITIDTHEKLKEWFTERQKQLVSSQHIVQNLKIINNTNQIYTLEFEFEIEEKKINGDFVILRLKEKWKVLDRDDLPPLIIEISESHLFPIVNSGSRIQC